MIEPASDIADVLDMQIGRAQAPPSTPSVLTRFARSGRKSHSTSRVGGGLW